MNATKDPMPIDEMLAKFRAEMVASIGVPLHLLLPPNTYESVKAEAAMTDTSLRIVTQDGREYRIVK